MATTATLLAAIDVKIAALIENQETDYKIGDKFVSAGQKMKQLMDMRAELIKNADADAVYMAFDADNITIFGEDRNQVVE